MMTLRAEVALYCIAKHLENLVLIQNLQFHLTASEYDNPVAERLAAVSENITSETAQASTLLDNVRDMLETERERIYGAKES